MKHGCFYFISDSYYTDYDRDKKLMQNKESINGALHSRPCFYAFNDSKHPEVYWCVPISSKIEKYENIVNKKLEKQRLKGIQNPRCNTICFSEVMGRKRAFLIQNIFPVTQKHIESCYINKDTGSEVRIVKADETLINKNANEVLKLAFRGIPVLFTDVVSIYKGLVEELEVERKNTLNQDDVRSSHQSKQATNSVTERLAAAKEKCAQQQAERSSASLELPNRHKEHGGR